MSGSIRNGLLAVTTFCCVFILWQIGIELLERRTPIAQAFGPVNALVASIDLLSTPHFWTHIGISLKRIAIGLAIAVAIGVPLGLLTGLSPKFAAGTSPLFQFLRMISPLSWMPLAVIVLGVGDAPVIFLLAFAAVWPILINTAVGVSQLDKNWLLLGKSLTATKYETITKIVLPGITSQLLTGIRLSIGLLWIVIVPAEMLGVSAGLGYFILDTRDRLAYSELMAAIILIGLIGWALDYSARWVHTKWSHH
jgi:NitT/TauT family transport system permease protein